jgi:hypothetical protein
MNEPKIREIGRFKIQRRSLTPDATRKSGLTASKITLVTGALTPTIPRALYDVCVSDDENVIILRKVDGKEIESISFCQAKGNTGIVIETNSVLADNFQKEK